MPTMVPESGLWVLWALDAGAAELDADAVLRAIVAVLDEDVIEVMACTLVLDVILVLVLAVGAESEVLVQSTGFALSLTTTLKGDPMT